METSRIKTGHLLENILSGEDEMSTEKHTNSVIEGKQWR